MLLVPPPALPPFHTNKPRVSAPRLEYLVEEDTGITDTEGYCYAVGFGLAAALSGQFFFLTWLNQQRMGMKIRGAMVNAVYERALRLTSVGSVGASVGRTTNLMSVDAEKLFLACQYSQ